MSLLLDVLYGGMQGCDGALDVLQVCEWCVTQHVSRVWSDRWFAVLLCVLDVGRRSCTRGLEQLFDLLKQ